MVSALTSLSLILEKAPTLSTFFCSNFLSRRLGCMRMVLALDDRYETYALRSWMNPLMLIAYLDCCTR